MKVGLLPALPAAVADKAAVARARWHTARTTEQAAYAAAERVLEALVDHVAALATLGTLQAFLLLFQHLHTLLDLNLLQLLEVFALKVALELDHDIFVESTRSVVEPENDEEHECRHQVDELLKQKVFLKLVAHVVDGGVVARQLDAVGLVEIVDNDHLGDCEHGGEEHEQQVGRKLLLRLVRYEEFEFLFHLFDFDAQTRVEFVFAARFGVLHLGEYDLGFAFLGVLVVVVVVVVVVICVVARLRLNVGDYKVVVAWLGRVFELLAKIFIPIGGERVCVEEYDKHKEQCKHETDQGLNGRKIPFIKSY